MLLLAHVKNWAVIFGWEIDCPFFSAICLAMIGKILKKNMNLVFPLLQLKSINFYNMLHTRCRKIRNQHKVIYVCLSHNPPTTQFSIFFIFCTICDKSVWMDFVLIIPRGRMEFFLGHRKVCLSSLIIHPINHHPLILLSM